MQRYNSSTDLTKNALASQGYAKPTTQHNPLKSRSMECLNQRIVDNDPGEGKHGHKKRDQMTVVKGKHSKDQPPPLNSARLRSYRQVFTNATINVLSDKWVCLEMKNKQKNSGDDATDRVVEVIRISPNGMNILVYAPQKTYMSSDTPPPLPNDPSFIKEFDYDTLPQKYWKKYQYAAKFVNVLRSKTPKITYYTSLAKCMLMENSPKANFEVLFYDGKCVIFCILCHLLH